MIYLASNSPRRRELLQQIHVRFEPLLFRGPPPLKIKPFLFAPL